MEFVVLLLRSKFIYSWKTDVRESLNTIDCIMDKICFKEIVSNTKLDQFCIIHYSRICMLV